MIPHKLVLVLGAGASIPYGFPSGTELKNKIADQCKNYKPVFGLSAFDQTSYIPHYLEIFCGFQTSHIQRFGLELSQADLRSVDIFLEGRKEFREIGKCALVVELVKSETLENVFSDRVEENEHWYQDLLHEMCDNCPTLDELGAQNKLSIITYNYDRSLEAYFLNTVKARYQLKYCHDGSILNKLNILHLHGQLGTCLKSDKYFRDYSPDMDPKKISFYSEQISIIDEASPDTEVFAKARKVLRQADRICFLGFGYGSKNLHRILEVEKKRIPLKAKRIIGTGKGFTDEQLRKISKHYFKGRLKCGFPTAGSKQFLLETAVLWK